MASIIKADEVHNTADTVTLTVAELRTMLDQSASGANMATAWVNFNGVDGTTRASSNIASVVRDGVGLYTITFSTPMANANYALAGMAGAVGIAVARIVFIDSAPTTTSFTVRVENDNSVLVDDTYVNVIIFGGTA